VTFGLTGAYVGMWDRRLERLPALALDGGVRVAVADRPSARLAGLAGLRALPPLTGLLIPDCRSIHTYGMRFALDLIWLTGDGSILDVTGAVPPGRVVSLRHASAVAEAHAGSGARLFAALASAPTGSIPTSRRAARALR
jgi:uncharacterized membrane protein (UPF0127 family)